MPGHLVLRRRIDVLEMRFPFRVVGGLHPLGVEIIAGRNDEFAALRTRHLRHGRGDLALPVIAPAKIPDGLEREAGAGRMYPRDSAERSNSRRSSAGLNNGAS